ncbi:hypothetical protein Tco_1488562 [Tanacetum coccineum]
MKGRAHKSRIEAVSNEKGERFEGSYVADQFVQHFKNFLGNKVAMHSMDLESLNYNIVGDDDAANMIKAISEDGNFRYHWGCKGLKISHLFFTDDLIVLCYGDLNSVKVVKKALDKFSSISGLNPNIGKSTVFFGNVKDHVRQEILSLLPFNVGELSRGKAKVAWKNMCRPKNEGGLGIKDLGQWNEVLMAKHLWNIASRKESL